MRPLNKTGCWLYQEKHRGANELQRCDSDGEEVGGGHGGRRGSASAAATVRAAEHVAEGADAPQDDLSGGVTRASTSATQGHCSTSASSWSRRDRSACSVPVQEPFPAAASARGGECKVSVKAASSSS